MPDLQALLDQIDRLDQEATKGPWTYEQGRNLYDQTYRDIRGKHRVHVTNNLANYDDGEFIALARTFAPAAAKALRAVMELHRPFDWSFSAGDQVYTITSCKECARLGADEEDAIYPCPTVQAVTDEINRLTGETTTDARDESTPR